MMIPFISIVAIMNDEQPSRRHILFSVKEDPQTFPAATWQAFRAACDRRGEKWVAVLRRLVEQYMRQEQEPRP